MIKREEANKLTDAEVFEKAIEKAVKNGWDMFGYLKQGSIRSKQFRRYYFTDQNYTHGAGGKRRAQLSIESTNSSSVFFLHISIPEVIFDHGFAKAFWGGNHICRWCGESKLETKTDLLSGEKNTMCMGCGAEAMDYNEFPEEGNMMRKWQYYLQQMVIEENPIQYLAIFLEARP